MAIPSIAMIPSGYKASKLYSVLPTDGSGDLDVVRATTATRVNQEGLIEGVLSNVPRLDYTSGGCPSILVEPQRTNLLLRSEEFNDAYWTKDGTASVTPNTTIAPNGTLTADTVSGATGNSTVNTVRRTLAGLTTTHTSSVYVKSLGATTFSINNRNGISGITTRKIVTLTSNWQRVELSSIIQDGQVCFGGSDGDFAIWGAQLEQGPYASSYIPTVASTVTRNADVISKTGISDLIGQTEGTLFVEASSFLNSDNDRRIAISDGTINNRIFLYYAPSSTSVSTILVSGGTTQANITTSINQSLNSKFVITYKANNFSFFVNGVKIGEDLSFTIPTNMSRFGLDGGTNAQNFFGNIKSIIIEKTAISDVQAIEMSTL